MKVLYVCEIFLKKYFYDTSLGTANLYENMFLN